MLLPGFIALEIPFQNVIINFLKKIYKNVTPESTFWSVDCEPRLTPLTSLFSPLLLSSPEELVMNGQVGPLSGPVPMSLIFFICRCKWAVFSILSAAAMTLLACINTACSFLMKDMPSLADSGQRWAISLRHFMNLRSTAGMGYSDRASDLRICDPAWGSYRRLMVADCLINCKAV